MDKIRILLVDDNITFLNIAASFLSDHDALSLAANLQPDVVLLDVNMPGLSGIQTTPHLRRILPAAGILMLSFQNSDTYREAALLAGADDFIPTKTLAYALLPAIHRVSNRRERFVSLQ